MSHPEIITAADAVAHAVVHARCLPDSEAVVLIGRNSPIAAHRVPLPLSSATAVGDLAATLRYLIGASVVNTPPIIVVFGSPEQSAAVAVAVESAFPDTVAPVVAFFNHRAYALTVSALGPRGHGHHFDLLTHPIIVGAVEAGTLRIPEHGLRSGQQQQR